MGPRILISVKKNIEYSLKLMTLLNGFEDLYIVKIFAKRMPTNII